MCHKHKKMKKWNKKYSTTSTTTTKREEEEKINKSNVITVDKLNRFFFSFSFHLHPLQHSVLLLLVSFFSVFFHFVVFIFIIVIIILSSYVKKDFSMYTQNLDWKIKIWISWNIVYKYLVFISRAVQIKCMKKTKRMANEWFPFQIF